MWNYQVSCGTIKTWQGPLMKNISSGNDIDHFHFVCLGDLDVSGPSTQVALVIKNTKLQQALQGLYDLWSMLYI